MIEGSILNPLLPTLHETDILYHHPLGLHTVTMHYRIRSTVTRAVNAILSQLEPEYWTRFSSHPASLACARPTKSTPKSVSDGFTIIFRPLITCRCQWTIRPLSPVLYTKIQIQNGKTGFTKFSKNYAMTLDYEGHHWTKLNNLNLPKVS